MMRTKLLILLTILLLFIGDVGKNDSVTYISLVDRSKGFNKVINTAGIIQPYENNVININIGDTIIWINNDISDRITIISEQGLWKDNDAMLLYTGRRFNYTFNDIGTYIFHIEQYKTLSKQTVIVSGLYVNNDSIVPESNVDVIDINPVITHTIDKTNPIITHTENMIMESPEVTPIVDVTNISVRTDLMYQILVPLNILNNLKMTGMITFIMVILISFIKK